MKIKRFGISLDKDLLAHFDAHRKGKKYTNRSEAIRDLIREDLVKKQWTEGREVAGTITMIYDHHKRELLDKLVDIQHDFGSVVISTQHVHLDHHNCLEIVVFRGNPKQVIKLADRLKAAKGVKHTALSMSSTGKDL